MSWTARQKAMLREMGVHWPDPIRPPARLPDGAAAARPMASPPNWAVPLSWPALQEAVVSCNRCALCASRQHSVFGVGQPGAHWMIVGEAPGEQEDRRGEPFVGPAGQLLDRMLASVGLSRTPQGSGSAGAPAQPNVHNPRAVSGVFITNTVKCRPPQNRNPQPEELEACAPVLWRQIDLVRPSLILAMGRFAAQELLGSQDPIGRLRGRVHRLVARQGLAPDVSPIPVVVTYHPAYLLRNPADKAKAWEDLCLALDIAGAG